MSARIRPIGDDDECDETPQVGTGCAELSPHEDTVGLLHYSAKVVLRMRKAGATYVKIGDFEVSFMEAKGE